MTEKEKVAGAERNKGMRDKIPLAPVPVIDRAKHLDGSLDSLPPKELEATLLVGAAVDIEGGVQAGVTPHDVGEAKARMVKELIKFQNLMPKDALAAVAAVTPADNKISKMLKGLIDDYSADLQTIRKAVRAVRTKVMVEALEEGDTKTVLEATRQIATDPGVGLQPGVVSPPQGSFVSDEFARLLNSVETKAAVLPAVDAEFEMLPGGADEEKKS